MPPLVVSLSIPEGDIADTKAAAEQFSGLVKTEVFTPTGKELLAAVANQIVEQYRHKTAAIVKPGVN